MLYSETLRKGKKGLSVSDLQRRLNHHHFRVVGPDDGDFGGKTELAVVRFQDAFGLQQDGKVGPITQHHLLLGGQVSAHFNIFHDVLYSRGNGDLILRGELIYRAEKMRTILGGKPMIINSCFRDERYNFIVGGASRSQHKLGKALDVVVVGVSPTNVGRAARRAGFTFIQIYSGFTHCDIR
jgi:peptidoglycan hydrolase-like protein with peptidoglycan-binding domain